MKKILVLCLGLMLVLVAGCAPKVPELPPTPAPPTGPVGQAIVNIDTTAPGSGVITLDPSTVVFSREQSYLTVNVNSESIVYNKGYILASGRTPQQWVQFTIGSGSYPTAQNPAGAVFIVGDSLFNTPVTVNANLTLSPSDFLVGEQNTVIIFSCDKLSAGWDCHSTGSNWLAKGFDVTKTGSIDVKSNPSGANIYGDGEITVYSTNTTITGVPAGSRNITLKKSGYYDSTNIVNVVAGQTTNVIANLVQIPTTGSINVRSNPSGATIYKDGVNTMHTTNDTLIGVPAGSRNITLKKSGYYDNMNIVNVVTGQTANVIATLAPIATTGSIYATSTPTNALFYVDGVYKGNTTLTVPNVAPGTRSVTFGKSGYQNYTTSATVTTGLTTNVIAPLALALPEVPTIP